MTTGVPSGGARPGLLRAFEVAVLAAGSDHRAVHGWPDVVAEVAALARTSADPRVAIGPSLAAAEPGLVRSLSDAGLVVHVPADDAAATVADVPVGLVRGELAVAETGSVVVAELALADRVVTMLCRRLFQVVHADDVAARLEDVAGWLSAHSGEAGFVSLMTGPSRTADIERSLTIGVQGPEEVSVRVLSSARESGVPRPAPLQVVR